VVDLEQLFSEAGPEAFRASHDRIFAAGEPLLLRAQEAGVARTDVAIGDVIRLVGGIAKMPTTEPDQTDRAVAIALDGLRSKR